ncbi:MAG: tRNA (adenosine(37)-N6)-threonylcarbamoyltransferase complex dimerization subunit type 1 TsaB [Candidatus Gracilibacteria bacterium]|jgi:tRNA threonylcarbamoyl adenosine modification protein YeaZ|nr:tRNA (adenosine(37)-N6)-threonylcarbamoyltransferase complex dimerization subunit type 1 TsaB [Candidatus Gracilibacteria bacterium]
MAISTAFRETKIALISDDLSNVLNEKSWPSDNNEAEKLIPEIYDSLKSQNLDWKDLSAQIVVNGPGSFTGLRIGIVIANTLKYLLKNSLFHINTFDYFWSSLPENLANENTALLIYAGQGGLYLSKSKNDTDEKSVEIVPLNQIIEKLNRLKVKDVFGEISPEQKALLTNLKFHNLENSFGENMKKILSSRTLENEQSVVPLYIKPPAITKAKDKIFNQQ